MASAALGHIVLVALALAAYVALTITGNDGNPVFVFVGGQLAGAGLQAKLGSPPQA